ncbi:metal-dependent hydrolase [soil metagenome]
MDNITHTLFGAALGQAGLRKYAGLGTATLMIAANIPDLDALVIPFTDQLPFRRGWTHGPIGLVVLPVLLTAAVVGFDRWQARRGKRPAERLPVTWIGVLALAFIGTLSHPFLDWLNSYGVRLLMPFSHEWYYGDAIFIIDPWIWLVLGTSLFLGRRRRKRGELADTRPALCALAAVVVYVGLMIGGSRAASDTAQREIEARGLGPVERIMAGPVPVNPLRREIIYDRGDAYGFGMLTLVPWFTLEIDPETRAKLDNHPAVQRAVETPEMQGFLYWSRFPYFDVQEVSGGTLVRAGDARYGWASSRDVLVRTSE